MRSCRALIFDVFPAGLPQPIEIIVGGLLEMQPQLAAGRQIKAAVARLGAALFDKLLRLGDGRADAKPAMHPAAVDHEADR